MNMIECALLRYLFLTVMTVLEFLSCFLLIQGTLGERLVAGVCDEKSIVDVVLMVRRFDLVNTVI